MKKTCDACGASRFRLSRFRFADVPLLFAFRYPVRCLECKERSYASVSWAFSYQRRRRGRHRWPPPIPWTHSGICD